MNILGLQNIISDVKNLLNNFNSIVDMTEYSISIYKDVLVKISKLKQKEKRLKNKTV